MFKTCTKCNEAQGASSFYKHPAGKDGLSPTCKSCKNAYQAKSRATRTVLEATSVNSVMKARGRSDLSSADLYGGLSYTEACAMTLPFAKERLRLEAETGEAHHIDHIIPICYGGTHTQENLQVLTAVENLDKRKEEPT